MPREVFFRDRTVGNKVAFGFYRLARFLYVGFYYYFSPFVVVYLMMIYNEVINTKIIAQPGPGVQTEL